MSQNPNMPKDMGGVDNNRFKTPNWLSTVGATVGAIALSGLATGCDFSPINGFNRNTNADLGAQAQAEDVDLVSYTLPDQVSDLATVSDARLKYIMTQTTTPEGHIKYVPTTGKTLVLSLNLKWLPNDETRAEILTAITRDLLEQNGLPSNTYIPYTWEGENGVQTLNLKLENLGITGRINGIRSVE
jgi:hypothetical protein